MFILITRLFNGRDYNGKICGSDDVNVTKRNIYYPKVNNDIIVKNLLVRKLIFILIVRI